MVQLWVPREVSETVDTGLKSRVWVKAVGWELPVLKSSKGWAMGVDGLTRDRAQVKGSPWYL